MGVVTGERVRRRLVAKKRGTLCFPSLLNTLEGPEPAAQAAAESYEMEEESKEGYSTPQGCAPHCLSFFAHNRRRRRDDGLFKRNGLYFWIAPLRNGLAAIHSVSKSAFFRVPQIPRKDGRFPNEGKSYFHVASTVLRHTATLNSLDSYGAKMLIVFSLYMSAGCIPYAFGGKQTAAHNSSMDSLLHQLQQQHTTLLVNHWTVYTAVYIEYLTCVRRIHNIRSQASRYHAKGPRDRGIAVVQHGLKSDRPPTPTGSGPHRARTSASSWRLISLLLSNSNLTSSLCTRNFVVYGLLGIPLDLSLLDYPPVLLLACRRR
ncbi:hypothetical protein C8R43DRAFT_1108838 [Mycena crocata]|nr:hypothetical protein C8R43DRAFT_1108838 [Mycena crocata]